MPETPITDTGPNSTVLIKLNKANQAVECSNQDDILVKFLENVDTMPVLNNSQDEDSNHVQDHDESNRDSDNKNTETMLSRMQMSRDVAIHTQNTQGNNMRSEADLVFRCKLCKFTFISQFTAIQYGIHTHPEYGKNINIIAEAV